MEKEIIRWYNKIWKTKGIRFISARRFELHKNWSIFTISIVSVYVIGLNLAVLIPDETGLTTNMINFLTIILSVLVLVVSLVLTSRNYGKLSDNFHNCSKELNSLYDRVYLWKNTEVNVSKYDIEKLSKEYNSIIDKYDINHTNLDYLRFKSINISDFHDEIKYPNLYYMFIYCLFYLNTIGLYFLFILLPLILILKVN